MPLTETTQVDAGPGAKPVKLPAQPQDLTAERSTWPVARASRITRRSSGPSPTCCAATTSSPSTDKVILPLTVIRRLDCVLEPTKQCGPRALGEGAGGEDRKRRSGSERGGRPTSSFFNRSPLTFTKLLDDPEQRIADALSLYVGGLLRRRRRTSSTSSTSAVQIERLQSERTSSTR